MRNSFIVPLKQAGSSRLNKYCRYPLGPYEVYYCAVGCTRAKYRNNEKGCFTSLRIRDGFDLIVRRMASQPICYRVLARICSKESIRVKCGIFIYLAKFSQSWIGSH